MASSEVVVKMEVDDQKISKEEENKVTETEETTIDKSVDDSQETKAVLKKESASNSTTAGAAVTAFPQYRVKISGLPRFYTPTDPLLVAFKKLLHEELGLDFKYIRSPKKGNSWLYITFYNQNHQEKALKMLKYYKWKGRTLICTLVVADVLKRKQEDSSQETSKKPRLDIPIEEQMLMSTIPYHSVSYEEQLSKKNEEALCLFKWLAVCMEKKTPQLIGYIDQEMAKNPKTKLPFKLDEVRASPVIDGYRNKCEFRIGLDPQTKKVVVGYRVDNQEDDIIAVAPTDSLRHLPKEMIDVVKVVEKFVQESAYSPQITNHDTGVWRLLHVRINKAKQLMVVILINPTTLSVDQLVELKNGLIKYFSEGPASSHNVVSLYLHTDNDVKALSIGVDKTKRPQGQLELLWGQSHMEEPLLDLKLDIDPNFYFQNNTYGAEVLYKALVDLAGVDKETTVLDLCCGSGGMGMMLAKHCKEVIGVEVMDVNVDDAKKLAAKNGLTNCEFLKGSVDDLFPELEEKLKGRKVVPILDPPRVGISSKLILCLRKMQEAQRIIYVCSNHKLPSKNIMDLSLLEGEKKDYIGTNPFFPTRVIPVDLSPHSLRCELVILLERLDMEKVPKPKRVPPNKTAKCIYFGNYRRRDNRGSYNRGNVSRGRPRGANFNRPMPVRDSLYPPPLRGNLYQGRGYDPIPPPRRGRPGFEFGPPPYPRRDYDDGLNRYSDFRRDVEDAIDSSYTTQSQVSQRLAMANAMLEKGLRLAEEAMAEQSFGGRMFSGPRNVGGGVPWNGNNTSSSPWMRDWDEDKFDRMRSRGGNRGYGGSPSRAFRGNRSGSFNYRPSRF